MEVFMKEASMTFRVETGLREQFAAAAEREHRPAAQVLREFMRAYVEKAQEKAEAAEALPRIDAEERERRQAAVNYGWASVGLEGFPISEEDKNHAQRFIDGEIDLQEFVKVRDEPIQERR
jgi:predicted DNA-binding protein